MRNGGCDLRGGVACALSLAAIALPAQAPPRLSVAFAATAATSGPPALAWLCGTWLPQRREWPPGLPPGAAIVLTLTGDTLQIEASDVPVPAGAIAAGTLELGTGLHGSVACAADGTEDWYLTKTAAVPTAWLDLLRRLEADVVDRPRTIDAAVLTGHLAGAAVEGDPRAELLQLGAALCGQVTWLAWRTDTHLRVRGRSDGGLLLPALLALYAGEHSRTRPSLPLRAFCARDGDRAEAARRLVRTDAAAAAPTLRALLHGDDELRLSAIDTLVRLGACDELPNIVAAASPAMPWATVAAVDAVHALWADADATSRQRTRAALLRSSSPALRRIDTRLLSPDPPGPRADDGSVRARLLLAMLMSGLLAYGFWLRERTRLHGGIG